LLQNERENMMSCKINKERVKSEQLVIAQRACTLYRMEAAQYMLIQPVDEHDLEGMDREVELIGELTGKAFSLLTVRINDWQAELTPWKAPAVFGKVPFGEGAADTLKLIIEKIVPALQEQGIYKPAEMPLLLGGYSLAGLFALWTAYQTGMFQGVVAASPSVWYPGWTEYAAAHVPQSEAVYLSLGDKEEKARNQVMARVGDAIRTQHQMLTEQGIRTTLEWNAGNHFVDAEVRTAKGFGWIINK